MGYKFNQKTGYWEASYIMRHPITRMPVGLRRKMLKSESEAKKIEKLLIKLVSKKIHESSLIVGKILYKDLLLKFYESLKNRDLSKATVENYQLCLNAHTLKLWGDRTIDSIKTDEIRVLIRESLSHRTPHQQKNVLKFIRGAFNFALEAGLIDRSPVPKIQFRMGDKIKGVLNMQQAKILLEKALEYESPWYPIWATALYTGMRNGELHALTWDKVDFENGTILVSSSWNKKDGFKDLTKSGVDRIIDIAPPLREILLALKLKSSDSVFVLPRMAEWDDGRQAEMLRMFLMSVNLPVVRFHDLRASWATMLMGLGVEIAKVMKLGGWADIKTMMIYMRKAGIDVKGTLEGLNIHDPTRKTGKILSFNNGL